MNCAFSATARTNGSVILHGAKDSAGWGVGLGSVDFPSNLNSPRSSSACRAPNWHTYR